MWKHKDGSTQLWPRTSAVDTFLHSIIYFSHGYLTTLSAVTAQICHTWVWTLLSSSVISKAVSDLLVGYGLFPVSGHKTNACSYSQCELSDGDDATAGGTAVDFWRYKFCLLTRAAVIVCLRKGEDESQTEECDCFTWEVPSSMSGNCPALRLVTSLAYADCIITLVS